MCEVAGHGAALFNFDSAGGELFRANYFWRVERDARFRRAGDIRCSHRDFFRRVYRGGLDAGCQQRAGFGFVLNHRAVRESDVYGIRRGGRGRKFIRENSRHYKGGIQLTAQAEQQDLFTGGRCPPGTGAPRAGGQPVQPVGDVAAGIYATGARI